MAILLIPVRETAIIDQLSSRRFVQLNSEHPPNLIIPPHPASPGRYVGHQPATLFHRKNIDQLADDFTRNSGHVYPSARNRMVRSEIWINDWPVYGSIWIPCRKVLDQLLTQLGRYSISMVFDWDTLDQNQRESNVSGIELSSLNDLAPRQDTTETVFYDGESLPESLYQTYKSVPEIGFRRHGPALGFSGSCFWGNVSVMSVAKDMSVRCYTVTDTGLMQTFQSSSPNPEKEISTRCIQVGQGWAGSRNHHGQFYINETKPLTNETSDTVSVDFYSLSRIVFLNSTTRNCGIPMVDGRSNPPCDWNALFSESPSPGHRAASLNQQVVEYSYRNGSVDADGSQFNPHSHVYSTAWCNSASHLGFGTYELAATRRLINATGDARLTIETEPEPAEPVYIHPDWVLASWEVSHSVTVPVDSNNPAATLVLNALRQVFSYRNAPMKDLWGLFSIHAIIMISALGIIDYDELPLNDADPESTSTNRILDNFITSEMWVYKLSSQTSVLAFTVVFIACAVVGLSIALSLAPWPFTTQPTGLSLFRGAFTQHPAEKLGSLSVKKVGWLPYKFVTGQNRDDVKDDKEEDEEHSQLGLSGGVNNGLDVPPHPAAKPETRKYRGRLFCN